MKQKDFVSIALLIIVAIVAGYLIVNQQSPVLMPVAFPTPTPIDKIVNWKTYTDSKLNYSFQYPPPSCGLKKSAGSTFTVCYLPKGDDGGPKHNGGYIIELGFISQEELNLTGVIYCGQSHDPLRCEPFEVDKITTLIDWGTSSYDNASVWINHPNGGMVTFALQPVTSESRAILKSILSTFKFTNEQKNNIVPTSLEQQFTLKKGQIAKIADAGLEVEITEFYNSPCPPGAKCIWYGLGVGFEYRYNGEIQKGVGLTQAFGYQTTIVETDYKTYANLIINKNAPDELNFSVLYPPTPSSFGCNPHAGAYETPQGKIIQTYDQWKVLYNELLKSCSTKTIAPQIIDFDTQTMVAVFAGSSCTGTRVNIKTISSVNNKLAIHSVRTAGGCSLPSFSYPFTLVAIDKSNLPAEFTFESVKNPNEPF